MKRMLVVAAVVLTSSLASPARAADAKSGAATELARTLLPQQSWSRGVDRLAESVRGRFEGHPGSKLEFPPDFATKVRAEVASALPYEEYVAVYAKALASGFSEAELKELVAFYKTPIGQKAVKTMPAVSEKFDGDMGVILKQKMPGILQSVMKLVPAAPGGPGAGGPHGGMAGAGHGAPGAPAATPPAKAPAK